MILFISAYILPFIIGCSSYLYLINKERCCGHLLGWVLCMLPMINLAWAIILTADALGNLLKGDAGNEN